MLKVTFLMQNSTVLMVINYKISKYLVILKNCTNEIFFWRVRSEKIGMGRVGSKWPLKFSGRVRVGYLAYLVRVGSISGRVITRSTPIHSNLEKAQFI